MNIKNEKKATAKAIAEELNLSLTTVDRALNNRGNVKKETYNLIMDKAKELNYTPNKLASFLSRKQQFNIAVIYPEYPRYFWGQIEAGIRSAYHELSDYGLNIETYHYSDRDLLKSAEMVREIIQSQKYDGIALTAGEDVFIDLIDEAMDSGIQVCTFNNDSPASQRLAYIGSDYRASGRLAAELISKLVGMSGKVAIIKDGETSYQILEKVAGFREVVKEYPNIQLVGPVRMDRDKNSFQSLERIKETLTSVQGIYVANAELANVAKYMEQLNLGNMILIGHDLNQDIYQYLQKNIISLTITQDPVSQGYLTVKKLFNQLSKQEEIGNQDVITKLGIISKENAKFYIEDLV
ncbi:LacI family DNA-binding transcriptional regulator [Halalkalibacter kiskunsagensis]|uniref:LacI family DNA-binding transcriptional regulator n=1 Tax=Halalkalibacter kiskunsagensis TaxID=1548599 RepID=A0ABV6KFS5_9BACI